MLGSNSYTGDEARVISSSGLNFLPQGVHPVLYRMFLFGWIKLFGTNESATRMLSVIFGTLALLLIYLIGKELGGRKVGLIALCLGAISPFLILFSRISRVFPCFLFFNLSLIWVFLLAIKDVKKLWIYTVVAIISVYVEAWVFFTLLCEWIWLLIHGSQTRVEILRINSRKIDKKKWAISQLLILLASSFLIVKLFAVVPNELASINRVPASLLTKLGYTFFSFSLGQTILPWNLKVVIPGIFIYSISAIYGVRVLIRKRWIKESLWLLIFILIPLIPICTNPNFPHYYLGVASLYYILLGIGIAFMRMRAMIPILILIAGVNVYGIKNIYTNREYHLQGFTDNWREISTIVAGFSDQDTKVVSYHQAFFGIIIFPILWLLM
ncbi:glycosyltransferase family 39 protein [candidate division WOR-3 bacterium]|nr:glycosyltransferase family 39 protein [candidate division WOR-3 bacterium]